MRIPVLYVLSALIAVAAIYAGLTGAKLPYISGSRATLLMLAAAGFAMCSFGAIGDFIGKAPAHPLTIAGYLLGALALFIGIVHIANLKVPYLSDHKTAFALLAIIIVVKFIIARLKGLAF